MTHGAVHPSLGHPTRWPSILLSPNRRSAQAMRRAALKYLGAALPISSMRETEGERHEEDHLDRRFCAACSMRELSDDVSVGTAADETSADDTSSAVPMLASEPTRRARSRVPTTRSWSSDFSDMPPKCIELLGTFLKKIEPTVSEIDWDKATLAEFEAFGDQFKTESDVVRCRDRRGWLRQVQPRRGPTRSSSSRWPRWPQPRRPARSASSSSSARCRPARPTSRSDFRRIAPARSRRSSRSWPRAERCRI